MSVYISNGIALYRYYIRSADAVTQMPSRAGKDSYIMRTM